MKLNFTKEEIKTIKEKIYLTELQEKIFDMKLKGDLTETGMAMELANYRFPDIRKMVRRIGKPYSLFLFIERKCVIIGFINNFKTKNAQKSFYIVQNY